ncbi:phthalate transporter [Aspergillus luchuensis]|uniref:Phthalate transporter n=1 Tax=Aspergillus kawachii TaxID=1069201 RepID=A0A146FR73_ASPKA|nr:phthalate transporter [Aspergillus luchuensis]
METEKSLEASHIEDAEKNSIQPGESLDYFTPKEKKRLTRRIDIRLEELKMNAKNNGYSISSLVFFITYTVFQPPMTVIIRKLGPRLFLSAIVLMWGIVMIGFGLSPTWPVLAGLRVILGALEAGFYPGCVYLLSTWYPRFELQKRNALFYLIGSTASGFGGILAYGLMQMDGLGGKSGPPQIEGILTCVMGIGSYAILVDFPEQSPKSWHFLNESEAAYVVATIENDRSDVYMEPFTLKSYLRSGADSKVWAYAAMYMLTTANSYSIAYFLPIILEDSMGFSVAKAQCLVAPPYVAAAIVMYTQAVYADKWHLRGPIIAANAAMGLLGLALLGYLKESGPRYFGVFLATIAGLMQRASNNVRGQWKRAFTSATLIGGGSIGGIIGTTVFRAQDAPNYRPGLLTTMIANALIIVVVAGLSVKFWRANKRVDRGGKAIEGLAGFKYTY